MIKRFHLNFEFIDLSVSYLFDFVGVSVLGVGVQMLAGRAEEMYVSFLVCQ